MVGNGGEIGQHYSRRQSTVNSPRRLSRSADSRDFDSLMEIPKLLQRGASFKQPSPARYQQLHHNNTQNARSSCQKRVWVTFLLCLSGFLVLYFSFLRRNAYLARSRQAPIVGFAVVIDIGRHEARINVFEFKDTEAVDVRGLGCKRSVAPLAAEGGYDVSALLVELLGFLEAKRILPKSSYPHTRVYVVGTGGLEWLPDEKRGDLLQECRKFLHESEFQFRDEWAAVIDGREEGVYEWVAANHARGMAQSGTADTIGVLTLSDDSAQVTFVAEEIPPSEYLYEIELLGTTHNLYSYSFEKLGLETASKSLLKLLHGRIVTSSADSSENLIVIDPCAPRGYGGPNHGGLAGAGGDTTTTVKTYPTEPVGNFTACRAESLALLQQGQDACLDKKCSIGAVFVPELRGDFIATRKFYETSKYFSLPAMASLADLAAAGENYCGQGGGVQKDPFLEYEEVRKPCFSAAFILAFLHDSLGLPVDGNKVMFTNRVNSRLVEWTTGFFITRFKEEKVRSAPPGVIFGESFGNAALFVGLLAIAGLLLWFVIRWRRPQLKTIYDLEKGRYITTASRGR